MALLFSYQIIGYQIFVTKLSVTKMSVTKDPSVKKTPLQERILRKEASKTTSSGRRQFQVSITMKIIVFTPRNMFFTSEVLNDQI